ncbi:MAG: Ni/Fe hydrogenase subunit alpha [Candidatus Thermoplasmatota archaeon]|nr:Ni/Fe hydrogenase subunit alpha [Candidatus Thermoplasmatota archaeon]MBS3790435.1 Ni/Fe hydrogenase subunit alpha [Candidatus Thermoplasmatota archaeon]
MSEENNEENKISIDPITRLEGHGKIEIFLDDQKDVDNAYLQVPEYKGFEKFCEGRKAEDMPNITNRICGVCPEAHHLASTKALDEAYNVEPSEASQKLRELFYNAYIFADHILHFYYLASPDFLVGVDAPREARNILGVIQEVGEEIGNKVIKQRGKGQKIVRMLAGKSVHPAFGIAGGVSKSLDEEEREELIEMTDDMVDFAEFTLDLFKDEVLSEFEETIRADRLKTYSMGLTEDGELSHTGGTVNVVDPEGEDFTSFTGGDYMDVIREHKEPYSYMKFPYLKEVGWNGFEEGEDSGVYRVGPLGRINASEGMKTELAQEKYEEMFDALGYPVHSTLSYHWARLIEVLQSAELLQSLAKDDDIMSDDIRKEVGEPSSGVGIVEAARGTLIHDYELDERGLMKNVNLIVATNHNASVISMSVRDAAKKYVDGGDIQDGMLNSVERAFRAYDPCLACATHSAMGETPLKVNIYDIDGDKLKEVTQGIDEG